MCSILLVEDHDDTRVVFTKLLKSWGHDVSAAESVRNGLELLEKSSVDVVLSDIGLPDGDGCDLIRAVRRSHPDVIAIAVSAYCVAADKQRSLESGFDMHFAKPVDLVRLHSVLAATFARRAALQSLHRGQS